MSFNVVPAPSEARRPRGIVTVNGVALPWVSFDVTQTSYNSSTTFNIDIAVNDLPDNYKVNYFTDEPAIYIEIYAGFPANSEVYQTADLKLLMTGQLDELTYDPPNGMLRLWGRDFSAKLLDTKITTTDQNLTSSQAVTQIALEQGLNPVVTSTSTKIGSYVSDNYTSITRARTQWDFVTALATEENFRVYVTGNDLHFEPAPLQEQANYYLIQYAAPTNEIGYSNLNAVHINFERNYTLGKTVKVTVRSSGVDGTVSSTVSRKHRRHNIASPRAQLIGQLQSYEVSRPGLSKEQARKLAESLAVQYSQQERRFRAEMPADDLMEVHRLIRVDGTNTSFDQIYYPETIIRHMDFGGAYSMTVEAKNHSPQDQTAV